MFFNPKIKKDTKVTHLNYVIPKIIINQVAFASMGFYVRNVQTEVGWLGSISRLPTGDFYIDEVFLLEQTVNGANTTITPDGYEALIMKLLETGRKDVINKLKFWGHSHVHMDVEPSAQDEDTLNMLKPDTEADFFLRGIFNKNEKIKFTLYDYVHNLIIDNAPWEMEVIIPEGLEESINQEIKNKVIENKVIYSNAIYNALHDDVWDASDLEEDEEYLPQSQMNSIKPGPKPGLTTHPQFNRFHRRFIGKR